MNYVTLDEAIELHDEIIELFGGKGGYNQVNIGYLASALDQIKNDTFYPTILEKVGHLMFSCILFWTAIKELAFTLQTSSWSLIIYPLKISL